jgi:anti-sigma factor RsiW
MTDPGHGLPLPLDCHEFRQQTHLRRELPPLARARFDEHAAGCASCTELLLECERLDDLLLRWQPSRLPQRDGRDFDESVLDGLRGGGPTASCAETTASLHHFLGGDLEPWLAERVERHLDRCAECRDHRDEARHSRSVWLGWSAPDPSETFADLLIRRLEPETRFARRRRQLMDWAFGPVHVPRAAAALVLTSITLLSLSLLQGNGRRGIGAGRDFPARPEVADGPSVRPAIPWMTATFEPGGGSDPTGSLSEALPAEEPGSFRAARRGRSTDGKSGSSTSPVDRRGGDGD